VLPVAKRGSLVFIGWVAVIIGCIYTTDIVRTFFIVVFYTLSIALYFWAVQCENANGACRRNCKKQDKRSFLVSGQYSEGCSNTLLFLLGRQCNLTMPLEPTMRLYVNEPVFA
jgi:hypothetical protein